MARRPILLSYEPEPRLPVSATVDCAVHRLSRALDSLFFAHSLSLNVRGSISRSRWPQ
jgi:hypothetical protein